MIPRFSNPHSLPQFTKTVPRAELYHDGDKDEDTSFTHNEAAIAELNQLLAQSIPVFQYESNADNVSPRKSKKRKRVESEIGEGNPAEHNGEESKEPPLFRLVSSVLPPLPVSLLPPPPPLSITREPDAEDSEHQAIVRRECAQAASVDAETIIREAKTIGPSSSCSKSKTTNLHTKLGDLRPTVMIVRTIQSPRKTRPPVHSSQLAHFPYGPDISTLSLEPVKSRAMDCPTVDAGGADFDASTTHRRSRRRRKTSPQDKQRPIAQFWRPSPLLTGKCRGYAYGYPGYLASVTGSLRVKYTRDRMKKGVHVDSI